MIWYLLLCTVASAERACRTYDVASRNDTAQKAVWEAVPRTDCEACLLFTSGNCTHACKPHRQDGKHQTRHDCPKFVNAVPNRPHEGWPALRARASTYAWPSWLPGPNATNRCGAYREMRARRDITLVRWMGDSVARQIVETSQEYCGFRSVYELGVARRSLLPAGAPIIPSTESEQWRRGVVGAASPRTVFVANAGLHHRDHAELAAHLKVVFSVLLEAVDAGAVALYAETTAQHFATTTGGYFASGMKSSARPIAHYNCVPASFHNASCHGAGRQHPEAELDTGWRNAVAWDAFRAAQMNRTGGPTPRLRVLRLHELTQPLWDLHPGGRDCTHFCFSPGLVEAILGELVEAVDAAFIGRSVDLY
jgi:hypothetical protein